MYTNDPYAYQRQQQMLYEQQMRAQQRAYEQQVRQQERYVAQMQREQQRVYNQQMREQQKMLNQQQRMIEKAQNKHLTDNEIQVIMTEKLLGLQQGAAMNGQYADVIEFVRLSETFDKAVQPHACKFNILKIGTLPVQHLDLNNATALDFVYCPLCRKMIYYRNIRGSAITYPMGDMADMESNMGYANDNVYDMGVTYDDTNNGMY